MKKRSLDWLLVAGLVELMLAGGSDALDIFRLGGEGEPRPSQGTFHQLPWPEGAAVEGLDAEALAAGVIRPLFLPPDQNIALTSVDRGGGPYVVVSGGTSNSVTEASKKMIDADPESFYEWAAVSVQDQTAAQSFVQWHLITLDLGALFHLNRVRLFIPPGQSGHAPDKLDVAANLGAQGGNIGYFRSGSGSGDAVALLPGKVIYRLPENVRDSIEVSFPSVLARSLDLLIYRLSPKAVSLAEVEVYGEGYIDQASYVSPFIDLGEPAIWGQIRWGGRKDPQARVWVQSRAGRDLDPNVYWRFTGRGEEVSTYGEDGRPLDQSAYARLRPGEAAPITYDTGNWSFWSAPYEVADSSDTAVLSPGPNSVFQLRVDFLNTVTDGGEVRFIEFSATRPPLAEVVVGEIYPPTVPLGETRQFTYAIRPTIRALHSGFDEVEIAAPFGLIGVDSVKVGGVPVAFDWRLERPDSTRFSIRLPRHFRAADSGVVVEVVFRSPVLRYGTAFDGWVRDSERPAELSQRINPGDAAGYLPSETLAVRTSFSARLLGALRVEPGIVTPNGDGVNEEIHFSFDLLQVTDEVPLQLEIFDLSGRLVRVVYKGSQQSGRFSFSWDGRDDQRRRALPGIYLYRLAARAEKGQDQRMGTVAVVY